MNIIQDYLILDNLDLPTIPWQQCDSLTQFDNEILWTVKNEPTKEGLGETFGKIGITAKEAKEFVQSQVQNLANHRMLICYPYYTAVKSGTLDLNYDRSVIEAVEGKIENLAKKNRVNVTMIFTEDSLDMVGDDKFLSEEESLTLIDYCKEVKKRCTKDLEYGKNILIHWSFVQETKQNMIPKEEQKLVFYKIKIL